MLDVEDVDGVETSPTPVPRRRAMVQECRADVRCAVMHSMTAHLCHVCTVQKWVRSAGVNGDGRKVSMPQAAWGTSCWPEKHHVSLTWTLTTLLPANLRYITGTGRMGLHGLNACVGKVYLGADKVKEPGCIGGKHKGRLQCCNWEINRSLNFRISD